MGTIGNKMLVRSFCEAGNRGDMEACLSLIDEDVVWKNMGSTRFSGTFRGKKELVDKLLDPLFKRLQSGLSSEIELLVAEDDRVVALTSGKAETVDGQPYNNKYCHVIRIQRGRFVEVIEYLDTELVTTVFGR